MLTDYANVATAMDPVPEASGAWPRAPEGWRIYAFGDVHGRADLLARLRDAIVRAAAESDTRVLVVGLGDYIDRGPDSRGAVDLLLEGFGAGIDFVPLLGNHEALLLRFLDDPESVEKLWFDIGGLELLRSYGVDIRPYAGAQPDVRAARADLLRRLPAEHIAFFRSMPVTHVAGDYLFVHAGVRAGISLDRQSMDDLLWIRSGFSDRDEPFEKLVVHGHTPIKAPFFGRYRINIDTAAYATSRLTCVVLQGSDQQVLQIEPS